MTVFFKANNLTDQEIKALVDILLKGGIGVLPTDTIYGIHTLSLKRQAVEKVYSLRNRSKFKPFIILISSLDDLKLFDIDLDEKTIKILNKIWPNPVSAILPCFSNKFEYLHRGNNTLAFRLPKNELLLKILKLTGPLISTSVNLEGEKPAQTIDEAFKYFGDKIDLYLDSGRLTLNPSTVIEYKDQKFKIIREGKYKFNLIDLD